MADPAPVGSAAWTRGVEYADEYADRIQQLISTVNLEALKTYASTLRGHRSCAISDDFSVGNFNLVRKIEFDDGVEWIAKLRMPPMPDDSHVETDTILLDMQSELATMEFVRQNTDIPVPKVHGYDLHHQNAVGCPLSIIDYIPGNTAQDVSRTYPGDHRGIPQQFEEKFWRQMARIMIKLASIRMPKIGSIVLDKEDPNSFVVGPLVETGSGPYVSVADFYADYPLALSASLQGRSQPVAGQQELVEAFLSLAPSFSPTEDRKTLSDGFGLANYDLNPNNVLVDREFNVLAVIDWDSVVAVPDAALYRFPFLMGVDCAVLGVVDTHPAVLKRQQLGLRFAEVVEEVGRELAGRSDGNDTKRPVFNLNKFGFFSKEAAAFRSLTFVKMRQDWVNSIWIEGLKWLSEHSEAEVAKFCLGG